MKDKTSLRDSIKKLFNKIELDFLKKVSITFITQILILITGLITSIVIARYLGPSGKGILAFLTTISTMGIQISNLGLYASNTYYVSKEKSLLPKLIRNSNFAGILLGFLSVLVFISIFLLKPDLFGNVPSTLLIITILSIPFQLLILLYTNMILGLQKIKKYNYLLIINNVLINLFIIMILLVGLGLLDIVLFQLFFSIIVASGIISYFYFTENLKEHMDEASSSYSINRKSIWNLFYQFKPDVKLLTKMLKYGLKIYSAALFSFLVLKSDIILVNYFMGSYSTGIYSVAVSFGDLIYLLPVTVAAILFPKVSSMTKGGWDFTLNLIKYGAVLMLFISFTFLVLINPLIILLFGSPFINASTAFIFLLPGIYFLSLETIAVQYLAAKGFPVFVVYAWILAFIVNFILNILLIPVLGINGAAISSAIAYILITALVLYVFKRQKADEND